MGDYPRDENKPASGRVSVDEMMTRLNERPSSQRSGESEEREFDPETGKVKIRRRRRVKKIDPKTRARKARQRLFWIAFSLVAVLAIVISAIYYVVWGGVRTDAFRSGVEAVVVSKYDQHDVDAQLFSLSGSTLLTSRMTTIGVPGSMISKADMTSLTLELDRSSFHGGDWSVRRCSASELQLFVRPRNSAGQSKLKPRDDASQPGGFLLNRKPERMNVGTYSFWNTDVVFGDDERRAKSRINDASITLSHLKDGGYAGKLSSAELLFDGWPRLELDRMQLAITDEAIHFDKGSVKVPRGEFTFFGDLPLGDGDLRVTMNVSDVNLEQIVTGVWKPMVDGVMSDGQFDLTMDPADPTSLKLTGDFSLSLLRLRQVRFLQTIESMLSNSDHEIGLISGVSGSLIVGGDQVMIDKLQMETANGVLIRGALKFLADGSMEGRIRLGVPPDRFGVKQPTIFTPGDGGLVWAMVNLSGTRGSILDDFKTRINESARARRSPAPPRVDQPLPARRQASPDELFEALTPQQ